MDKSRYGFPSCRVRETSKSYLTCLKTFSAHHLCCFLSFIRSSTMRPREEQTISSRVFLFTDDVMSKFRTWILACGRIQGRGTRGRPHVHTHKHTRKDNHTDREAQTHKCSGRRILAYYLVVIDGQTKVGGYRSDLSLDTPPNPVCSYVFAASL